MARALRQPPKVPRDGVPLDVPLSTERAGEHKVPVKTRAARSKAYAGATRGGEGPGVATFWVVYAHLSDSGVYNIDERGVFYDISPHYTYAKIGGSTTNEKIDANRRCFGRAPRWYTFLFIAQDR